MKIGRFFLLCGWLPILLGVLVLTGWAADLALLKTLLPGYVTMKANTALGLALAGASLVYDGGRGRFFSPVFARW